jgi:hypothetical protein
VAALLTGEALQMVDICAGAHNHLKGRDDLKTTIFEVPHINMNTSLCKKNWLLGSQYCFFIGTVFKKSFDQISTVTG